MKVSRLKKGYTIRLSDNEFEAMEILISIGQDMMEGWEDCDSDAQFGDIPKNVRNLVEGGMDISITKDHRA